MNKRIWSVFGIGVAVVVLAVALGVHEGSVLNPGERPTTAIEDLVNNVRNTAGVHPLKGSTKIDDLAKTRCGEQPAGTGISHNGFAELMAAQRTFTHEGENLAQGFRFDMDIVNAWVASPKHYENLVNPVYTYVGTATCANQKVVELYAS